MFNLGPTCVGKGFLLKLLFKVLSHSQMLGMKVGLISFGQIIRDRMKYDSEFKEKYEPVIARGDLLDDEICIELFSKELDKIIVEMGSPHVIFVDGFCRTKPQIEFAIENGFLSGKDSVILIDAPFGTCLDRFAHRSKMDPGRLEKEVETFRKRYRLHEQTIGDLRALFKECEAQEFDIDGSGKSIPEDVFPNFLGAALVAVGGWHQQPQASTVHATD